MCVLSIALCESQLWYFKGAPIYHPLKELRKIQRRMLLYITEVFHTSLSWGVEAIAGLIPIHFHLNKLIEQYYLWISLLL